MDTKKNPRRSAEAATAAGGPRIVVPELLCPFSENPGEKECGPGCSLYQPEDGKEGCECRFRRSMKHRNGG